MPPASSLVYVILSEYQLLAAFSEHLAPLLPAGASVHDSGCGPQLLSVCSLAPYSAFRFHRASAEMAVVNALLIPGRIEINKSKEKLPPLMTARTQHINAAEYDRMIAVSDLHGRLDQFERLLAAVHFSERDLLLLLGDYIERGPQSLALLHRIMTLTAEGRACALMGNCDNLLEDVFHPRYRGDLLRYLSRHPQTILHEMLAAQGTAFSQETTLEEIRHVVAEHYAEEREFLQSLPHIIDAGDYIFVHAGLDDVPLSLQDPERCLKRSDFYQTAPAFSKTIVLGHMPCQRLSRDGSGAPVFDAKRNLVFIDGGVGLVEGAAMNALLIADGRLRVCSVP